MNETGKKNIKQYEDELLQYATKQLKQIPGLKIIGEAKEKVSVISFIVEGLHPQDLGILLDNRGIAVRTGHHCTQPLMDCYKIPGTVRASFAVYNTKEEIDELVIGLEKAIKMLSLIRQPEASVIEVLCLNCTKASELREHKYK